MEEILQIFDKLVGASCIYQNLMKLDEQTKVK